ESLTTSVGGIGSRLANRANMDFATNKYSVTNPTPEMLRAYYRMVSILSGDLNSGILGPFVNRSQNDISLLNDFLTAAGGLAQPRGIFVQGDGFGQSEKATGGIDPAHTQFLTDKLGIVFRNQSYQSISGNVSDCADVLTTTALTPLNDVYGVVSTCSFSNDVFNRNPALPESQEGAFYENAGLNGPYVSDVVKTAVPLRNWVAVTSGYEIEHLMSRYCDTDGGRLAWYYYMLNKVFSAICPNATSGMALDTPPSQRPIPEFFKIGNSVMRQGESTVRLGIAHAGRVQVNVYDVAGRKVRTLADRVFPAGEAKLVWDGTDDAGEKVGRGVYFVRSSTQREAGRVIVLNR
ncbi:MAG TPA: FlgD immunoglobulin-like domain containing protein, partial [Actinomycetota bacterium]|nr:FlgD immunoglobulin-like domain containing protein [Actinomycetota bacterium]